MGARLRDKLTYANVMVTLLMFIVLGGGAYAATKLPKNSVGTAQIKENAVTGSKVEDGSLTGPDIDAATLGTVPSANHAASADRATLADEATLAAHAGSSDTAEEATTLDGFQLESFRDACQPNTGKFGNASDLCYGPLPREEELDWVAAVNGCTHYGTHLPSPSDAGGDHGLETGVQYWTDDFWTDEGVAMALAYRLDGVESLAFEPMEASKALAVRCVSTPSDIFSLTRKPPAYATR